MYSGLGSLFPLKVRMACPKDFSHSSPSSTFRRSPSRSGAGGFFMPAPLRGRYASFRGCIEHRGVERPRLYRASLRCGESFCGAAETKLPRRCLSLAKARLELTLIFSSVNPPVRVHPNGCYASFRGCIERRGAPRNNVAFRSSSASSTALPSRRREESTKYFYFVKPPRELFSPLGFALTA